MENISGVSSSSSSMEFVYYDEFDFEFVEEVECLSNWEILDASDADSEVYRIGEEEDDEDNGVDDQELDDLPYSLLPVESAPISLSEDQIQDRIEVYLLQNQEDNFDHDYGYDGGRYDSAEAEEDEIDDDEDEYDLDDELVPWSVSSKFGRQRIRKLGKRAFPKMYNSKKSPYLFTKPGCVRGKHGLGLKHSN